MTDAVENMLKQSIGAGYYVSRYSLSWFIGGALREMAQQIEQNGVSKVVTAVAVIVISAIILGAGSAGVVATYTNAKLDERMTSGFCHINQRLDEIQHPQLQPRQCE